MITCSAMCWSPKRCWILQDYCFLNRQMIKFFKKCHWHADNHLFSVLLCKRVMHAKIVSDEMFLLNHGSECLPSSNSNYRHLWNWHCPYPCRQMLTSREFSQTVKHNAECLSCCFVLFCFLKIHNKWGLSALLTNSARYGSGSRLNHRII